MYTKLVWSYIVSNTAILYSSSLKAVARNLFLRGVSPFFLSSSFLPFIPPFHFRPPFLPSIFAVFSFHREGARQGSGTVTTANA